MDPGVERALKLIPVAIVRHARKFYELLGNRRKFERIPTSGTIFATFKGSVVDTTYACDLVNISPGGIAIDSLEPMKVDSILQLHSTESGPRRLARVRYCLAHSASYRIGLEFIADRRQ
jgi:hypothetical protein